MQFLIGQIGTENGRMSISMQIVYYSKCARDHYWRCPGNGGDEEARKTEIVMGFALSLT